MVEQNLIPRGCPHVRAPRLPRRRRAAVDTIEVRQLDGHTTLRRDLEKLIVVIEILREADPFSVGRPPRLTMFDRFSEHHPGLTAGNIDNSKVVVAVAIRDES